MCRTVQRTSGSQSEIRSDQISVYKLSFFFFSRILPAIRKQNFPVHPLRGINTGKIRMVVTLTGQNESWAKA